MAGIAHRGRWQPMLRSSPDAWEHLLARDDRPRAELVFHIHNKFGESPGLLGQIGHGLLRLAHGIGCLVGHLGYVVDGMVDFIAGRRLLPAGLGNGVYLTGR